MPKHCIQLLLIEDSPSDVRLIQSILTNSNRACFVVECAERLSDGISKLAGGGVDAILLDLNLPDSQELDTFRAVHKAAEPVPILILSGINDERLALQAIHEGAQDYVDKNQLDAVHLDQAVLFAIEREEIQRFRRENEQRFRELWESMEEVFWLNDSRDLRVLYVSPAYERIWGRPCQDVYERADSWISAVKATDRDRVRTAFERSRIDGWYNEEFQIERPNGTLRWIWDRRFPIRDATGQLHRIAGISADVTDKKRLEQEIVDLTFREQQRIGHDLHDGLGQELTGLSFLAKGLEQRLRLQDSAEVLAANELLNGIGRALRQLRTIVSGLVPPEIDAEGLSGALYALAQLSRQSYGIACRFEDCGDVPIIDTAAATHLYRIAQEAINNSAKHARASEIVVVLSATDDHVVLSVRDNGQGICGDSKRANGIGHSVMRYRAAMIGGSLRVGAAADGGAIVTCFVDRKCKNAR